MSLLSIIIPSRTEQFLQKTVDDVLEKSEGEIEVIVVLDGYEISNFRSDDARVRVIKLGTPEEPKGMRACINKGVESSTGYYIMKTDEHCMFDKGFDIKMTSEMHDDWVMIPRRYRLDAEKWEVISDGRPPIDYMYLSIRNGEMHGWKDDGRSKERIDVLIDDLQSFQGSCWLTSRKFWDSTIGPMDDLNYGPFAQEAQEIGNKAWLSGGRVVINKKTWYAHWHRNTGHNFTNKQQREFKDSIEKGRKFCVDFWTNNKWDKQVRSYNWLVEKFSGEKK